MTVEVVSEPPPNSSIITLRRLVSVQKETVGIKQWFVQDNQKTSIQPINQPFCRQSFMAETRAHCYSYATSLKRLRTIVVPLWHLVNNAVRTD